MVDVPAPAEGMTYRTHRMVHGMYGLNFQKFGDYQVSWVMDGMEVQTVHFRVIQAPAAWRLIWPHFARERVSVT